jgi:hypothetical protein
MLFGGEKREEGCHNPHSAIHTHKPKMQADFFGGDFPSGDFLTGFL